MKAARAGTPDPLALLAFAIAVVLLGINFVAVRFSNRELDPFWGAGLRFATASALLFALVVALRVRLPRGSALIGAALYGLLNFGATYGLSYWSMLHVPAGTASVVFAVVPLATLLVAVAVGLERLTWRALAGALIVVAGIAVVFHEQLRADVPATSLLAVLLAAVCSGLSVVVVKRFPGAHPFAVNAVGMATGATLLLGISLVADEVRNLPTLANTWIALAWLVTTSIIGFVLVVWLLTRWTASATSYLAVLMPLVTVATAAALAAEPVTPVFLLGGAVVLFGVAVGLLAGRPKPTSRAGTGARQASGNASSTRG
jgi:drug/metabolite transporter (DMT)-like permease